MVSPAESRVPALDARRVPKTGLGDATAVEAGSSCPPTPTGLFWRKKATAQQVTSIAPKKLAPAHIKVSVSKSSSCQATMLFVGSYRANALRRGVRGAFSARWHEPLSCSAKRTRKYKGGVGGVHEPLESLFLRALFTRSMGALVRHKALSRYLKLLFSHHRSLSETKSLFHVLHQRCKAQSKARKAQ